MPNSFQCIGCGQWTANVIRGKCASCNPPKTLAPAGTNAFLRCPGGHQFSPPPGRNPTVECPDCGHIFFRSVGADVSKVLREDDPAPKTPVSGSLRASGARPVAPITVDFAMLTTDEVTEVVQKTLEVQGLLPLDPDGPVLPEARMKLRAVLTALAKLGYVVARVTPDNASELQRLANDAWRDRTGKGP